MFVQINILEGRAGNVVLIDHVFSHYFILIPLCDNINSKYINENCCIENLAASKYSMCAQRGKQI